MKVSEVLFDVIKDVVFYRDINDTDMFYAEFENCNGELTFESLDSEGFKSFLLVKSFDYIDEYKEVLDPNESIKTIRCLLLYYKKFQDIDVNVRISGNLTDFIEYDLQSDDQKSVVITQEGWDIVPKKRKFVTSKASQPQVEPVKTKKSPLNLLQGFINIFGDSYILLVVWVIQAFLHGSHFILWLLADRGSGKTTLSKIIKRIVDPCKFSVTTIPDKKSDLCVLLNSTHLCCFDNLSHASVSNDVSDLFCGAVTGTSVVKRSLYTNCDIDVCALHNTLVLNGISYYPERDDIAERMILMHLKKLDSTALKSEKEMWVEFEKALPEILGSIFNTLSRALNEINNVSKENLPRMTDAFIEMLAIARALDISEEKFREIYNKNQEQLKIARESSPVVTAVKEYMKKFSYQKIEMYSTKFYNEVFDNFSGDKSLLPGSAAHFSQKLDKEFNKILNSGYRVNIDPTGSKGTKISVIKK